MLLRAGGGTVAPQHDEDLCCRAEHARPAGLSPGDPRGEMMDAELLPIRESAS